MSFERRIDRFCAEYPEAPRDLILASRLLLRSARLLRQHIEQVKTGLPGMAYVQLDPAAQWPDNLKIKLTR